MLAEKLAEYGKLYEKLIELTQEIEKEVLALQQSQSSGGVTAKFMKGRKTVAYDKAALESSAPQGIIDKHTTPKVNWKSVCADLELADSLLEKYTKTGEPSVSIKVTSNKEEEYGTGRVS